MFNKIKDQIKNSQFIINIFSVFHHSFIIRKWIYNWIKNNSKYIKWKVLDFWCWEKPYKSILNFKEYIWVDFKSSGHDNTQNNVDFFWDWTTLPFKDEEFNSIITTEVFEHIFNIDDVLSELNRILKKGWNIVITIPFVIHEHEVPYDFARYTHFWIESLLEKNWFKVLKNEQYWSYFQTILQLCIWFLWKITYTRYKNLSLFLRVLFVAPIMVLINIISIIWPKMQWWLYLSNVIVWEKK